MHIISSNAEISENKLLFHQVGEEEKPMAVSYVVLIWPIAINVFVKTRLWAVDHSIHHRYPLSSGQIWS